MNRITPNDVLAAKEATGFPVEQCAFIRERGDDICLCGLSVVAVHRGLHYLAIREAKTKDAQSGGQHQLNLIHASLELSHHYAQGFIDGFDFRRGSAENPERNAGLQDGIACAAAVFGEAP